MMETEMFYDDARFHHRAALVHEHRNTLERPQGLVLGRRLLVARREHAKLERGVVLVKRDQHLLAVRSKGVGIKLHGHLRLLSLSISGAAIS